MYDYGGVCDMTTKTIFYVLEMLVWAAVSKYGVSGYVLNNGTFAYSGG